jgi:hypothetical protein
MTDTKEPQSDIVYQYLGDWKWDIKHINPIIAKHFNIKGYQKETNATIESLKTVTIEFISLFGQKKQFQLERDEFKIYRNILHSSFEIEFHVSNHSLDPSTVIFPFELRSEENAPLNVLAFRERGVNAGSFYDNSVMMVIVNEWDTQYLQQQLIETRKENAELKQWMENIRSKSSTIDELLRVGEEALLNVKTDVSKQ